MAIVWTDVQAIAPELTSTAVPTTTQTVLLAMVDRQIDDDAWDDLADDGRRYLAAHLGALYAMGGSAGGAVTMETLGPMSRSYSVPQKLQGTFAQTKYGVWYMHLVSMLPSALGVVP